MTVILHIQYCSVHEYILVQTWIKKDDYMMYLALDQFVFIFASEIPRPVSQSFQKTFLKKVFPISIDESFVEQIDIGDVLASSLPNIISNLVLSSRIDAVPLLVYTISCEKDVRRRL